MKTIHPAVAEHVMEENERLRGLLAEVAHCLRTTDEQPLYWEENLASRIYRALSQQAEPVRSPGTEDAATMLANGSQEPAPAQGELPTPDITTKRGYPAYSVELVSRLFATHPAQTAPQPEQSGLLEWVVDRWHAEVANRPLINLHRRTLDSTWRQVIRRLGEDDVVLIGPRHDDMLDASGNPLPQYAALSAQGTKP
ncbi:hypothetical protein [Stutzerimonas stutzeri]|uniref:hypothetical protein n=1 Tax=Stutzerimonas stutzeri TaxID=316 RepID=UPI00265A1075|nr:hypothetical protein [Stutzerimonas stutzeri]MCF6780873.1 hypothetical protein [Stutzerimonas stutzeri]MCF6803443.1 hypothetical protein [Stutzerimonas stutzeri]